MARRPVTPPRRRAPQVRQATPPMAVRPATAAINYARITNTAALPEHATVSSNGATIEAVMGSENELGASATSGAGGGAVGIAGSVAIEIEQINTTASLAGTLHAGTGDVRIAA